MYRKDKYLSSLDTSSYLSLVVGLQKYLTNYYLAEVGIAAESISIIGISGIWESNTPCYQIDVTLTKWIRIKNPCFVTGWGKANIRMSIEEFNTFLRIIKIKKFYGKNRR